MLRSDKKITIFKDSTGAGRQLMASVEVMKKREGRLRVNITWKESKEEDAAAREQGEGSKERTRY